MCVSGTDKQSLGTKSLLMYLQYGHAIIHLAWKCQILKVNTYSDRLKGLSLPVKQNNKAKFCCDTALFYCFPAQPKSFLLMQKSIHVALTDAT